MPYNMDAVLQMLNGNDDPQRSHDSETAGEVRIVQLDIADLVDFPPDQHKFRPATGQRLTDLENSIRANGILNALHVRPLPNGEYQIIAGHNRRTAARNIGYRTVPCIIRRYATDDEAILALNADNLDNRELLPSERAWAYRQIMDVRKRRAGRPINNSSESRTNFRTDEKLAEELSSSKYKIQRYIRLTYLIPPLLTLVDEGKLGLGTGEQLSYLKQRSQETVYSFCYARSKPITLREAQAKALREAEADPDQIIDEDLLEELTAPKQKTRLRTVQLKMSELRDYFPAGTPEEVVLQTIHTALAVYFEGKVED